MESICKTGAFEVFSTSQNRQFYGKSENYLKIHNYVTWIVANPFQLLRVQCSLNVGGVSEDLGDFVLTIKSDNHANNGGVYDNFVIFDVRDLVNTAALYGGTISFRFGISNPITLSAHSSTLGFDLIEQHPLKAIPFELIGESTTYPFWFSQNYWKYFVNPDDTTAVIGNSINLAQEVRAHGNRPIINERTIWGRRKAIFTNQFSLPFGTFEWIERPHQLELEPLSCSRDWELIQWTGSNGNKKSWWFEVIDRQVYTNGVLQLFDVERNNKYLKDANARMTLRHESADYATRCYLADLIQADDVEAVYTGGEPNKWNTSVFVENTALSTGKAGTFEDVTLNVNFVNHGRI